MIQTEAQYLLDHIDKHIPDDFVERIESIAESIKSSMHQNEYDEANRMVHTGVKMIRDEIQDTYCRSISLSFLIDIAGYAFFLDGVELADELFCEEWGHLTQQKDMILLNSYTMRADHLIDKRNMYYQLERYFCQGCKGSK